MTKEEALQIPSMRIEVDSFIEDCFYFLLAQKGKLSPEQAAKAQKNAGRMSDTYDLETYYKGMLIAQAMLCNIEKYGVACADWCEE